MAGDPITQDTLIQRSWGNTYSMNEAFELMEYADQYPTGNLNWNWRYAQSGNPVVLGIIRGNINDTKSTKK